MTRREIKHLIQKGFENLLDQETINQEGEVALYYYAAENHSGQDSDLYSILSTSDYHPGPLSSLESEGEAVAMIYDFLAYARVS